jgi:hypothetical protein
VAEKASAEWKELGNDAVRFEIVERLEEDLCPVFPQVFIVPFMHLYPAEGGVHPDRREENPSNMWRVVEITEGFSPLDEQHLMGRQCPRNLHASKEMTDSQNVLTVE